MSRKNSKLIKVLSSFNLLVFSLVGANSLAAPKKKKQSGAGQTQSAAPAAAPAKTVGELLKSADSKGAGLELKGKQNTALPTFSNTINPADTKVNPVNLLDVKPPRTGIFMKHENEDLTRLDEITNQQINELYKLTERMKSSPQRGELWLRLAELCAEKAEMIDHKIQDEYDKKLKEHHAGKSNIKPVLNLKPAQEFNRKAVQLYEWFIRDFPKDKKMDQALFFLGYNHYAMDDTKRGTQYYQRLVKEYPRSPFIIESTFALGEFYFENEKWADGLSHYRQVAKYPQHRLYAMSIYKVAWCEFRLGKFADALRTMETLIRQTREEQKLGEKNPRRAQKVKLEKEGLRDVVLFYSEVGDPKGAVAYFTNLNGQDAPYYLEKLAYLYTDKGNRDGGRTVFNSLIAMNPTAPKAFDYKHQIVQSYANANRTRDFREELYSWIKDFGAGSAWYQANANNTEFVEKSKKAREQTLRTWVLQQHQTAQNSRAQFAQGLAFDGYRLYLAEFPQSPVVADMRFYFGELLYDMGRFDEAGAQYRWVADNAPNSKFYQKATENTVLSLERNLPKDDEMMKRAKSTTEQIPMEPRVSKFIEAAEAFIVKFPTSDRTPEIKFKVGRLYYLHNHFERAVPVFKDIATKHSGTRFSEYSANLLLDIFNVKNDLAGLEKTGQELLAIPGMGGSAVGKDIKGVLEKASFKKAKDLDNNKDYKNSAEAFEKFAAQNPRSELALTALFNSAINYEKAGMTAKAMAVHGAVIKSEGAEAKKLKPKSRRIVAKLYQDSGHLDEAAQAFEICAQETDKKDPLYPNLIFNAGIIHEALGRTDRAIKNYDEYMHFAKGNEKRDLLFQIATMERKRNKRTAATDKYEEFLSSGGSNPEKNVEAAYWIYEINRIRNKEDESDKWRSRTLSSQKKYSSGGKGPGAQWAAKIKFRDALETFDEFKAVKFTDIKKLKEQSDKKISILGKLNKELTEIVKFDSPEEIVASLSLLGQANALMADALMRAPVPADLNKDEKAQYQAGVAKLAEPFLGKAKEILKAAVDKGMELESYTPDYHKARTYLATLDSTLIYEHGEKTFESKQINWIGH